MKPESGSRPGTIDVAEQPPILEAWYRELLSTATFDISSSGVQPYSFGEVRRILEIGVDELDAIALQDSSSFGDAALRGAIGARYAGGDVSRVMATHGSSEAISLVLCALLSPGDRVVVLDPIYHSLSTHVRLQQCNVARLPVLDCAIDEMSLARHVLPGTKAVIVNFPHNPTGITLTADARDRLVRRTAEVGAVLVWDGAMAELPMVDRLDSAAPISAENVISTGTLSKAFGLPGLRVGWCIAPAQLLERTLALRDRTTLFLSPLVELIAARVIEHAELLIRPRLAQAQKNLDYLDRWIDVNGDFVDWRRPEGGVCGLMHVRGVADTEAFCRELLRETGVLLVPGTAFDAQGAVRIGYGGDGAELRTALELLADFLRRRV